MTVAATAKRRRRQAAMGFTHLAPKQRPHYKKLSAETSARRLADRIATERRMAQGKRKGGSK